ncbi:MAG TPA: hypothetical protein VH135_02540 [Steroidobacteraceae bacterium]|nr:hypothetical protein [Steroidobacteraceae bacterium]
MARVLLALLLLTAGPVYAREPDVLAALETCAGRLEVDADVGYERIAARCPDLTAALELSPWAAWLPADWKDPGNQLNAEGLRALHAALVRESAATPGTRALHPERVRGVLERVRQPERAREEGWWAHFKRWLREILTRPQQEDDGWWRRLLGDAPLDRAMLRVVAALAIALLVVVALAVVMNELRVAGLLRRRPGSARGPARVRPARGELDLSDVEGAEPAAQPALLLELIAARLAAQDRLPPARAFTVRELTRRARLPDEAERAHLSELAAVSERVRYAAGAVAAPALAAALRGGRELLSALDAPATAGA